MTAPTRAIVYCRVSTDLQDEERQVADLRRLAEREGIEIVEEIRERLSGSLRDRPGLSRVFQAAEAGKIQQVLTWELSRLTRGGIGDLFDIVRRLDSAGVSIRSVQEPWATTTGPMRDLMLAILGWSAKTERDLLSARTKSGLAQARREGAKVGRPRRVTPEIAARILELRASGRKWSEVAMSVHLPSGTCRKVRPETPRVENPDKPIGTPAVRSEVESRPDLQSNNDPFGAAQSGDS